MADFQNLYHFNVTKTLQNGSRFCKTLVTRYNLPNYKVSGQLKRHNRFWIYPPLWTSQLLAMFNDIENTSITLAVQTGSPLSLHHKGELSVLSNLKFKTIFITKSTKSICLDSSSSTKVVKFTFEM